MSSISQYAEEVKRIAFDEGFTAGIEAAAMYVLEHGVSERGYTAAGIRSLKPEAK